MHKCVLVLELTAWDEQAEVGEDNPDTITLYREIHLPFVPQPNMEVTLTGVDSNHPLAKKYAQSLKASTIIVPKQFLFENVGFTITANGDVSPIDIQCRPLYSTSERGTFTFEERSGLVAQLIYGYGFQFRRSFGYK